MRLEIVDDTTAIIRLEIEIHDVTRACVKGVINAVNRVIHATAALDSAHVVAFGVPIGGVSTDRIRATTGCDTFRLLFEKMKLDNIDDVHVKILKNVMR
jgi:hypothetical protein